MSTQVARIGGQLLQDNLQRELADLAFDTDLLVVKRDNTLGINTTTTPRNLTINGTMRTTSGGSDPDIIFGNSIKVGDITLASSGISTASGDITIKSTHPEGVIKTAGIGSNNFAVKGDGILALQTNGGIGIRSEVFDGQTVAWETNANYGNYWAPGPKISASSPPNDMDRLYDYALSLSQSGTWTAEELAALDFDQDGDIQVDDVLNIRALNTQFVGGVAYPATKTLADAPATFKAYIEKYYPNSVPRVLQIQSGVTTTVTGDLHSTGNITYGGTSLTIGDDSTDSARFFADFHNTINPDLDNVYHIGRDDDSTGPKKGFSLFVNNLNSDTVKTQGITYQGINLTKNNDVIYVSNGNGSDTNEGYSPGGPYATITKALSVATEGTFIYIYPGTYQEAFPMTVPKGVTIQGDGIRAVEVRPTSGTQSNDCFLLFSDTVIENITIKDMYYSSGNDTGYAFRFANNFNTSIVEQNIGRSPYIRNCTVINKGSTTSASDPRGYGSADAGRGALVDGSAAVQNSRSASMLFHAVTFITPGQIGLLAKSGARVEWLNSFTYFAGTGIKLEQGTGRLQPDSTMAYGCELRSIASANVYGNKGIDADGSDNLAYLINHNFAYIGSGKDVTNDNTLTIQANEVVKSNNAKVYYTTQDQRGNFRVGDNFTIDLENERTSFDIESIFAENSEVQIRQGNNTISLSAGKIDLDNIVITGNTLETTKSNLDFNSTGTIDFNGNVVVPQIETTGNFSIGGSINALGDSPSDTVDFNTPISQNFVPGTDEALQVVLDGTIEDPSFAYNKTYTLTANGVTYTYGPTGDGTGGNTDTRGGNHYLGIADLGVPGLTYTVIPPAEYGPGALPVRLIYEGQAPGDTLILADTNGWTHVGLTAGTYKVGSVRLGTPSLRWNEVNLLSANIDSVRLATGTIGTAGTNADLNLVATGSGKIRFSNLYLDSNKVSTQSGDVVLNPTTEVVISATGDLKLPKGESAQRPATLGGIRYNTNYNGFEGTATSGAISLNGVYDTDRDTYLDLSNNQFNFTTGGVVNHTLNGTLLESKGFSSDNKTSINGNIISTDQQDGTFQLKSNGTGKTVIEDLQFQESNLFNNSNSNFIFGLTNNSNNAFLKIDNVNGIVPPQGNTAQRPTSPEVGTTRYNIEPSVNYVETWNGSQWINAAGSVESITVEDVTDTAFLFNLILD